MDSKDLDRPARLKRPVDGARDGRVQRLLRALSGVLALVLAAAGQVLLMRDTPEGAARWVAAAALYGAALMLFLALIVRRRGEPSVWRRGWNRLRPVLHTARRATLRSARAAPVRAGAMLLAVVLAIAVGLWLHRDNATYGRYGPVTGLWLLAIVLYVGAAVWPARVRTVPAVAIGTLRRHAEALRDAALLLAVALLLRLPRLGTWPDVLSGDEGQIGALARELAFNPARNPFTAEWAYSAAYYYLHAPVVRLLDGGRLAVRLPGALLGALAVSLTYWLGRYLFGRRVGLAGAVILATSFLHVHASRTGFGHVIDTLLAAGVFLAFSYGLDRGSRGAMALAGLGLGLAQYGYVGGRLVDLVIAGYVLALLVVDRALVRRRLGVIAVAFFASAVVAAPIIRLAIDDPGGYAIRLQRMGFVQSGSLQSTMARTGQSAWQVLAGQLRDGLIAPLAYPVEMFYFARIPMLDVLWGAALVLGVVLVVVRLDERRRLLLGLHVLGGAMVLAMTHSTRDAPYRVIGVLPSYALLAALGLRVLAERALPDREQWSTMAMASVVALIAGYQAGYLFLDHLPNCRYMDPKTAQASRIAGYLGRAADDRVVLALTEPHLPLDAYPTLRYLSWRRARWLHELPGDTLPPGPMGARVVYLVPADAAARLGDWAAQGLARAENGVIVVVVPQHAGVLDTLELRFGAGRRVTVDRCGEPVAEVYQLPP